LRAPVRVFVENAVILPRRETESESTPTTTAPW
jgi:hypothetical protein